MPSSASVYATRRARKPQGGFVLITVQQLCLVWWAYRTHVIRLRDFRVWLACQEMVARRCQLAPGQTPDYTLNELHTLVGGVGGEHLRTSLRHLTRVGLLTWAPTRLTFAASPEDLYGALDLVEFARMQEALPQPQRRVPVPRQMLRCIAHGCRATVIATILGHLLRCLYYHGRTQCCVSGGWCKASWIATVFHVDRRHVKAARRMLVTLGWLEVMPVPQRTLNRWGRYVYINLAGTLTPRQRALPCTPPERCAPSAPTRAPFPQPDCPPSLTFSPTVSSPPPLHKEPLQELRHQELPAEGFHTPPPPPRLLANDIHPGVQNQDTAQTTSPTLPSPTLQHVLPEDLWETPRLLALFTQATDHGLLGSSEHDRLTFVALAEHALASGTRNPCGLFATLLRRQQWDFITDGDDVTAQRRMKHYLYGTPTRATPPPARESPGLSPDAAVVRAVRAQAARAGWLGEGFGLVRGADPTWTRARWDQAVAELEQAQQAWRRAQTLHHLGESQSLEAFLTPWKGPDDEEDAA